MFLAKNYIDFHLQIIMLLQDSCYVFDKEGNMYDLSPLVNYETNYEIFHGSDKFIFNICNKLVSNKGVPCQSEESSFCLINDKQV